MPLGVDPRVEGPQTPADAALLLLALLGYDREAAIRALYGITDFAEPLHRTSRQ